MATSTQWPPPAERRLLDALAAKPLTELSGVVHPSGAGSRRSQGQPTWTFLVTLQPWRIADGPLHRKPLLLRQEVGHSTLSALQESIAPYQLLRFRAKLGTDPATNSLVALIGEHLGLASDPELAAAAEELQKPVEHHDEMLGTFMLDRRLDEFATRRAWNGAEVEVRISSADAKSLAAGMKIARRLFKDAEQWDRQAREYAAGELLETHNDNWRQDDDGNETPALTIAQFCARMVPESITIDGDGTWAIWYKDGDLFAGHVIQVNADKHGDFTNATVAG